MAIIRSRAPVRISFAGGGTDVSPYPEEVGGCVVNVAIDRYAYGTLILKDKGINIQSSDMKGFLYFNNSDEMEYNGTLDLVKAVIKNTGYTGGLEVFLRSDIPPRSGLGSSATTFVSLIGLFNHAGLFNRQKQGRRLTSYDIAELAFHLEREELMNIGGRQDQYSAVFGGLNFMEFCGGDHVKVSPLRIKKDYLLELEKHIVLAYVGARGDSGDIIRDHIRGYQEKNSRILDGLHGTKELANGVRHALLKGDLTQFGELIHLSWEEKKKFSYYMTNEKIDGIYEAARNAGALGGKLSGAGGGGGHMFFYCKPNTEINVRERVENAGAKVIDFHFDMNGLQTWEVVD